MKKKHLWVMMALMLLPLSGCDDDDDCCSSDGFWITTATLEKDEVSPYLIVTDNGDRLFPYATAIPGFEVKDNQRVWINYTILSSGYDDIDYNVKVNDISEILTKGILELTPEITDSIGDDPVTIKSYWFSEDFLTVQFVYSGGEEIHYINLVQDVNNPVDEQNRPILLFRHNRNDDPAQYNINGTVSFNLEELQVEGESYVQFVLKATSFEDEDPFEVVLTYNY